VGAKKPEPELGTERKKPITEAPKSRLAERRFAIDKVKQSENVSKCQPLRMKPTPSLQFLKNLV
jgi:hypothetical protein